MASVVVSRECEKCGTKYRTKLKKGGKDARPCPRCNGEEPVSTATVLTQAPH